MAALLITIGVLFLAALALDAFGRIVHVPRVTLLILLGAILGPPGLDLLPPIPDEGGEVYATIALTMVAFLLGSSLDRRTLKMHGKEILIISIVVVFISAAIVSSGLLLMGAPLSLALLLGGISAATAPAATHDVVRQSGSNSRFSRNLMGIVAIDDAWGLIVFSVLLSIAALFSGQGSAGEGVTLALREAMGGLVLGSAIGLPAAYLTGRLKPGEPSLVEALGLVFLCAGLSLYFHVSFLLCGMACGAIITNFAAHHDRPFHEIERIEWPFLLVFFVIAGASLEVSLLSEIGLLGVAYCLLRFVARFFGGWLGGILSGTSTRQGILTGMALMPQAGVAIGMALVASNHFPGLAESVLAITISSTIVFEIVGPLMTQLAIRKADATL